jgi:hypothetical protein
MTASTYLPGLCVPQIEPDIHPPDVNRQPN